VYHHDNANLSLADPHKHMPFLRIQIRLQKKARQDMQHSMPQEAGTQEEAAGRSIDFANLIALHSNHGPDTATKHKEPPATRRVQNEGILSLLWSPNAQI
jgi:hypothetical protein